jgi:hypothetical protein
MPQFDLINSFNIVFSLFSLKDDGKTLKECILFESGKKMDSLCIFINVLDLISKIKTQILREF